MALLFGVLLSFCLLISSGILASAFASNDEVRRGIMQCLPMVVVFLPVNGMVFVLEGIYSSARRFGILSSTIVASSIVSGAVLVFLQRNVSLNIGYVVLALNLMLVMRLVVLGVIYRTKWTPVPAPHLQSSVPSETQQFEDS
eukprot:Plantae.Rhodophyta-Purpureofilum_apyrenoidigerum.ctg34185.p2 GENE.Plantae.Rhodophyta-Purpureofilum_apyrenoidigerum.ctg34185~~Plantae.Rhodophyta-Purpureofilum_apyrenoidigerum.ctg34185.p2  ORF type:complete len:142 (-),score=17.93 Plantae.Rhodophyta-Purpureofilum_apyrenoidigerum.ctg34185:282-707(-)